MTAPDVTLAYAQCRTMCDVFDTTVRRHADQIALRTTDSDTCWTYAQYAAAVADAAAALDGCGVRRGDTVALMFENVPSFHIVDAAVMHLGAATCSIYNTSPTKDIHHNLRSSGARLAVCEPEFAERLREADNDLRIVVTERAAGYETLDELPRPADFDFESTWRAVEPDDVLTLIYTSGTTGAPKAVELTHGGILAEVFLAAEFLEFRPGDRVPSALPMAHAAQRWGTHYNAMTFALEVVCIDDIAMLGASLVTMQPDIWGTVPRILEKLVAAVSARLGGDGEASPGAQAIEVGARYAQAVQRFRSGSDGPPSPSLQFERDKAEPVLAHIRHSIGLGRLRWLMVGAAPTPPHVQNFLTALGIEVVEVWGMSELGAVATVNPVGAQKLGTVGKALRGVDITTADDGEVLVRGPILMRGYRGQPQETSESFSEENYFKTGDLGQIDDQGYLSITGRKKEIIVNAAGKNISPVKVESTIKAHSSLIGSVVAIGDARPFLTALVVLDPEALSQFITEHELGTDVLGDPAGCSAVTDCIADAIDRGNTELARVEQIKRHLVLNAFWLPGSDELTPTLKLKRRVIAEKFASQIDSLYAAAEAAQ
ncbi:MAG: AMP-binding protein [Mycobacterium sp.]|nr:AMP-binding protein [Mycobacterium sp.]